jgi:Ni/Co efflux regulator RcnB
MTDRRRHHGGAGARAGAALLALLLALGPVADAGAQLGGSPPRSDPLPPRVGTGTGGGGDGGGGNGEDSGPGIGRPPYERPRRDIYIFRDRSFGARLPERERVIVVPAPRAPAEAAPPPETGPPDPGSPRSVAVPRGREAGGRRWTEGEPLPEGVPHVTLDWRTYGLPEPAPGRIYARVGRDVLLIEAATRRVIQAVDPEAGGGAEDGAEG